LWTGVVGRELCEVVLRDVHFPPGDTVWKFETDQPAVQLENGDMRSVAFSLRNLKLKPKGRDDSPAR